MKLLDGKQVSARIEQQLVPALKKLQQPPHLAVLLVGSNPSSASYVQMKQRTLERLGLQCTVHHLPDHSTEQDLLHLVDRLNADHGVTGILVQLPLPAHCDTRHILDRVKPAKDVDGLHSYHLTKVLLGEEDILACTPKGVLELLAAYNISLEGKAVCIVGFSDVVGKPLATACLNRGATVTVCHSRTKNLQHHTSSADILMTAAGVPGLITADMVREGAVVVDIGITKVHGKIKGDVDFDAVSKKCSYITPVPGGVGPMTIMSLVQNLLTLATPDGPFSDSD